VSQSHLESWQSPSYVAQWASEDVLADLLALPRRLTAALVADSGLEVRHVIDVGAGTGAYLAAMLDAFPRARGTWLDLSAAMLELGRAELERFGDRITYVVHDAETLAEARLDPGQVVTSSRALHHLSPESLEGVYRAAFELLTDGGFIANLDHVGAPDGLEQVYRRVRSQVVGSRTRKLAPHRHDYPLAPADVHLELMAEAGFENPDTPWRVLHTALMTARKPG
jgi:SAM-dependent methyltransferase